MRALQVYYNQESINSQITVYHHAKTKKGTYRDTSLENDEQKEKGSVILYMNCVGTISFFFHAQHQSVGMDKLDGLLTARHRLKVLFCRGLPNPVIGTNQMSPPLVHVKDEGKIRIPKLPTMLTFFICVTNVS